MLDQGGDEKRKMSGKDIAMSLGFDTLSNLKRARDSLHAIAQKQRVQNALRSAPHAYAVDEEVLLSTENISLKGAPESWVRNMSGHLRSRKYWARTQSASYRQDGLALYMT